MNTDPFTLAKIETSIFDQTTNNTEIHLVSDKGDKLVVNVSPPTRQQLLMSLLFRPPSPTPANAFPASGVRGSVVKTEIAILEFLFGKDNDMAIPIGLPYSALVTLKNAIAGLEQTIAQNRSPRH